MTCLFFWCNPAGLNTKAATRLFLIKIERFGFPGALNTDKLRSYGAAKRHLIPSLEHRQQERLIKKGRSSAPADKTTREDIRALQIASGTHELSFDLTIRLPAFFAPVVTHFPPFHSSNAHLLWDEYTEALTA